MSETAPSGYMLENVISAWQRARARIIDEDPDLVYDETALRQLMAPEAETVEEIQNQLLRVIRHAVSMANAAKAEKAAMDKRRARFVRREEILRTALAGTMYAIGKRSVQLPLGTVTMAKSPPVLNITDPDKIPDKYKSTVTTVTTVYDEKGLLEDLEQGEVIEGAELSNQMPTLTIR